jgi:hypothetical protein
MSKYRPENKSTFSDYNSLNQYCNGMGIPYLPPRGLDPDPNTNKLTKFQVVPVFHGFNYVTMPYGSLNADQRGGDSSANNYATINQAYYDPQLGGKPCVVYHRRQCPNC